MPSGSTFDLPSSGFDPANLLAWGSPQGYLEKNNVMHVIAFCDVDVATRRCSLQYEDGQFDFWNGDMNIAAVTWMGTAAALSTIGALQWLQATLAGGEDIAFASGVVADGAVTLPSGSTGRKRSRSRFRMMPIPANRAPREIRRMGLARTSIPPRARSTATAEL